MPVELSVKKAFQSGEDKRGDGDLPLAGQEKDD